MILGCVGFIALWFIFGGLTKQNNEMSVTELSELIRATSTEIVLKTQQATQTGTPVPSRPTIASQTEIPATYETLTFTPKPFFGIRSTKIVPGDNSVMVFIPAGEFFMGSDPDAPYFWGAEAPEHPIYLDAFWINRTEVTNAMYSECVGDGVCPSPEQNYSRTHEAYYNNPEFANYPVVYVTYDGVQAYCKWIGARLPTEAEWEKAARGTDGRLYPWGNGELASNLANFCDIGCPNQNQEEIESDFNDGYQDVAPVGSFPDGSSPYGVLDMAGNVLEWIADWYSHQYYGKSPYKNPTGPENGDRHPVRGGSWYSGRAGLRTAARASLRPENSYDTLGFRCAMSAE
jgi:formylglycine-generating enzyme required for sulfatase activity